MIETNGKTMDSSKKDLAGILGIARKNPFRVKTEEELEEKMEDMSLIGLQKLAIEAGVSARGSVGALKKKICKSFHSFNREREIIRSKGLNLGRTNDPFSEDQKKAVEGINV
jgi:hypothetical protein